MVRPAVLAIVAGGESLADFGDGLGQVIDLHFVDAVGAEEDEDAAGDGPAGGLADHEGVGGNL